MAEPAHQLYVVNAKLCSQIHVFVLFLINFCTISIILQKNCVVIGDERVGAMELDGIVNIVGGTPSEGVDVASSNFPSVKNQVLIESVGL